LRAELSAADVRLLGPVPHHALKQIMGASDVLVLPSVEEGLALVLAEALACGCPVIASTNTGAADLISQGREGFIVPIRSPDVVAERLQRLARSPDLQRSMSQAALAKARAIGGWRDYGDAMMEVYGRLLSPSAPAVEPAD
jgi:glycosyltransferase involved in cell wall biosynthesis